MTFFSVKTNIKNMAEMEILLKAMAGYFAKIKYPDYKIKIRKEKKRFGIKN